MTRETDAESIRSAKILFRLLTGASAFKDAAGLPNASQLESGYVHR